MSQSDQAHLFAASAQSSEPHERVSFVSDRETGLQTIISVHDTRRGPSYGGCRIKPYDNVQQALTDALRLSEGMSLKNALANLPFGGGKAVIMEPSGDYDRAELMRSFGEAVDSVGGRYITAEDVGSSVADMKIIAKQTAYVGGLPTDDGRDGDPSPFTAYGVLVAMKAGARRVLSANTLEGLTVAIQGLGAVGYSLAELLNAEGAKLVVADINDQSTTRAADELGATVVSVDQIISQSCDILAPCALGAVLSENSIPTLQTKLICGAANNQLARTRDGDALQKARIAYLPDYLVNAGGIIFAGLEYLSQGGETVVRGQIDRIDDRVNQLLDASEQSNIGTHRLADQWARKLIEDPDATLQPNELVPA